jgi:ribosomal protein S12 methylthiotransferase
VAVVGFISLGCPKNLVDTEIMLGHLRLAGHELTARMEEAEILVVNTCGFIDSAKKESIQTILEAASMKRRGACKRLIVAGCMVERYRDRLLAGMPEIDAVVGTGDIEGIAGALAPGAAPTRGTTQGPGRSPTQSTGSLCGEDGPRLRTTHRAMAYVKISEGCSHSCAFCAIPAIRGPQRSRTVQSVLREAERLVGEGVLEINLVGQDTTDFGSDLGHRNATEALVRGLGALGGLRWFRLQYAHPARVTDGLLDAMAGAPNCCRYLDVPLQHAHAGVLKSMARGGGRGEFAALVERVRKRVPGIFIRSSFIVGFPGEDEAAFGELRGFVADARLDHVGVFPYSAEEGTPAFPLGDPVHWRTKEKRRRILMELQQGISRERGAALVGTTLEVMAEGPHEESDMIVKGRHRGQAPDIDGSVLIVGGEPRLYEIQSVRITEAHQYDLVGTAEEPQGGA